MCLKNVFVDETTLGTSFDLTATQQFITNQAYQPTESPHSTMLDSITTAAGESGEATTAETGFDNIR